MRRRVCRTLCKVLARQTPIPGLHIIVRRNERLGLCPIDKVRGCPLWLVEQALGPQAHPQPVLRSISFSFTAYSSSDSSTMGSIFDHSCSECHRMGGCRDVAEYTWYIPSPPQPVKATALRDRLHRGISQGCKRCELYLGLVRHLESPNSGRRVCVRLRMFAFAPLPIPKST